MQRMQQAQGHNKTIVATVARQHRFCHANGSGFKQMKYVTLSVVPTRDIAGALLQPVSLQPSHTMIPFVNLGTGCFVWQTDHTPSVAKTL